jgi:ureidoacrylate peracid hydrolase
MTQSLSIDPARTALLVIDMQNAFVMPGGSMARLGLSTSRGHDVIEPVHRLIEACRKHGLPVIHTLTTFRVDYADAGLVAERFPALQPLGHIMSGTWDAQIVDHLLPRAGEYVIPKSRFNAFYGTNLELVLRSLGVDTLIVAGVATNICVDSTIREAFIRDVKVILPRDATASYTKEMEEASLATLGFMFANLTTVDDVVEFIDAAEEFSESEMALAAV